MPDIGDQVVTEDDMLGGSDKSPKSMGRKVASSVLSMPGTKGGRVGLFGCAKERGGRFGRISPVAGRSFLMFEKRTLKTWRSIPLPP